MAAVGHEERFPPLSLNVGCGLRKETIARLRRSGRDAQGAAFGGLGANELNRLSSDCSSRLTLELLALSTRERVAEKCH
jgi:hypothetical protein